jgi:predicted ATP-grasp superfamily ATP-dependent carboligase
MNLPLIGFLQSEHIEMCCTVHNEQPSYPARIYGNKMIVIFTCEFQLNEEVVPSMVDAIYEFALRHRAPMIYTIEGMPTGDHFRLESGEEISLQPEEDEEAADYGKLTFVDDTKLADLDLKKKEKEGTKEEPDKKRDTTR